MNKGVRGILLLAGLLMAAPAVAGTVYRCQGTDGALSYSSARVSGARCKAVSSYGSRPSRSPVASVASGKTVASAAATPAASKPKAAAKPTSASAPRRVTGEVYSYVKDGVRHYSSRRPSGQGAAVRTIAYSYIETCYACGSKPGVDFSRVKLNTAAFDREIATAARQYGVGVSNAYDASQNIRGGVKYLAWLLKRFNGDLTLAAAGYNAGEGAVDKYDGVPPYKETQRYVERVGVLADRYRGLLAAR